MFLMLVKSDYLSLLARLLDEELERAEKEPDYSPEERNAFQEMFDKLTEYLQPN